MKIIDLIHKLERELSRGDEEIFLKVDGIAYVFDFDIDDYGQPLLIATAPYSEFQ